MINIPSLSISAMREASPFVGKCKKDIDALCDAALLIFEDNIPILRLPGSVSSYRLTLTAKNPDPNDYRVRERYIEVHGNNNLAHFSSYLKVLSALSPTDLKEPCIAATVIVALFYIVFDYLKK